MLIPLQNLPELSHLPQDIVRRLEVAFFSDPKDGEVCQMPDGFTEDEVDRVIQLRKWIEAAIHWRGGQGYQTFQVPVGCEEDYALRMIGALTERTGYCRYNLFLGTQPIRMLHIGQQHHNPDCERVGPPHRHRWTDGHGQRWAYVPGDFDSSELRRAFEGFAVERGIELRGGLVAPVIQMRIV